MIKNFGLKIFNGSQNFYVKCGLCAAQNFTAPRNFAEAKARFNARNSMRKFPAPRPVPPRDVLMPRRIRTAREILPLRTIPLRSELAPLHKILARKISPPRAILLRSRLVLPHKILSLAPSRHTQIKSGLARSFRRALGGSNVLPRLVMSPCRVRIKFAFVAPPRQAWIKLTVLPCRAQIKLARVDKIGGLN